MKINIGNHEFTELWDGFLPVKVKDEVKLANYVHMIVIPSEYKDQIMKVMPEQLSDRAFCLSHDKLDVWQWSEKVYSFVRDKNKSFLMISVIMVCSLTACGQQETGIMTKTGNSTEQVVASGDNSELATAEDNNMEQTEAKEQEVVQLPDEPSMDDSSSSTEKFENKDNWPDVEELVIKGVMRLRSIYWQMVAIWIA